MDFTNLATAVKDAKKYKGTEEYAAVFYKDRQEAYIIFENLNRPVFADYVVLKNWQ